MSCSCKGMGGFGLDVPAGATMTPADQQAMAAKLCALVDPKDVALVNANLGAPDSVGRVQAASAQWVAAFQTMSLADRAAVAQAMILGGCDPTMVANAIGRSVNPPTPASPAAASSPVGPIAIAVAVALGIYFVAGRSRW